MYQFNWKNKKVLVTGAGGFIASHLTEELVKKGAQVTAFVHYNSRNSWGNIDLLDKNIIKNLSVISGDITDPFMMKKTIKGNNIVFHLAALIPIPYSYVAPENYVNINIKGTLNVLEACREDVERMIHTSTSETYGTARFVPINETHPLQAQSPYSATKIAADKLAESYYLSFGLPVSTVRPFNTYGERQSLRAVIPTIISQLLWHDGVLKLGSTTPIRDMLYVKDTAKGFIKIAESKKTIGEVTNIGTGVGVSIKQIIDMACKIMGKKLGSIKIITDQKRVRPGKSEVLKLICDNSKARKLAGWKPEFTLEQGLTRVIDYMKETKHLYKSDIYNI